MKDTQPGGAVSTSITDNAAGTNESTSPRLPHERDQVPSEGGDPVPRPEMQQAFKDAQSPQVDTDVRRAASLEADARMHTPEDDKQQSKR